MKLEHIRFNNGNVIHDLIRILIEYNLKYNFAFDKTLIIEIDTCISFLMSQLLDTNINHTQHMKQKIKLIIEKSIQLDTIIDEEHNPNHKYILEKLIHYFNNASIIK